MSEESYIEYRAVGETRGRELAWSKWTLSQADALREEGRYRNRFTATWIERRLVGRPSRVGAAWRRDLEGAASR